ncbi:MAG: N-6 DNA methylase, partial [Acidobacteriota bacterium]|nr:N-6 DNA methylase [Acidobacteriota bacterium]
ATSARAALGPASTDRRLLEELAALFSGALGFHCRTQPPFSVALSPGGRTILLAGFPWQRSPALTSATAARAAASAGADWAAGFNGDSLAFADLRPDAPRRTATLDLESLAARAGPARLAAALLAAPEFDRDAPALAVSASDASSRELRRGLQEGVRESLDALTRALPFDAALPVLFRMLFVLFAEARSLVPVWHAIYRDHYSLDSLAPPRVAREPRGTWAALEAGRRLLREGCRAGTLTVNAFNGRLFEPGPVRRWARSATLDSRLDAPAFAALRSLTEYRPARGGARRVSYEELDVEELGSIYERVLDLDPAGTGRARKESGSFYTPRALTTFLVRRTLAPLTRGASSSRILDLRVVDPAMGSGAFLVAALHELSSALETALMREGTLPEGDVTPEDRRDLRRLVAQRCLYGVDANPTAVMLARLSLWLATLAADKPLGFLDHRLRCGNSLAGIDPAIATRAPGSKQRAGSLPLFNAAAHMSALRSGANAQRSLEAMREDTPADVRRKEKAFDALRADQRWRPLCDAWCAWWFSLPHARPDAREFRALADALVRGGRMMPRRALDARLRGVSAIAARERFFHWPLEFPEIFERKRPGFDAVLGNPPWEMLRNDSASADAGTGRRGALLAFVRGAGQYPLAREGHVNLYQLFTERALHLVRDEGRLGLIAPWGLLADEGSAALRRRLFEATSIDTLARFDNSTGVFQAHRGLRFAAIAATSGPPTAEVEITRVDTISTLDGIPDTGRPDRGPLLTRAALEEIGGARLRVPDVATAPLLATLLAVVRRHRALGDPCGWGASFGRELNLTDDRGSFSRAGMPVLEGKHVFPNRVDAASARHHITRAAATKLLPHRPFDRARLAYRDVTSPTNRHALIAAIVPVGAVTGHSLFCLRNEFDAATQRALCVILNSTVADFLIRIFVSSHVTTSLIEWLPVPDRARAVSALGGAEPGGGAALEALVFDLYGITGEERARMGRFAGAPARAVTV